MTMMYPPNISDFVDKNNLQTVTNVSSVLFNTKVKALKYDGHICTLKKCMISSLLNHKKAIKVVALEANITTMSLL